MSRTSISLNLFLTSLIYLSPQPPRENAMDISTKMCCNGSKKVVQEADNLVIFKIYLTLSQNVRPRHFLFKGFLTQFPS